VALGAGAGVGAVGGWGSSCPVLKCSNVRDSQAETLDGTQNRMTDTAAKTKPQRKQLMFIGKN